MEKAKALIEKYKAGTCTNDEIRIIDQWLFEIHAGEAADLTAEDFEEIETGVWAYVKEKTRKKQSLKLWPRIAAAAAILLIVGLGVFFYTQRHLEGSAATRDLLANDIKPGTNKAILTLANGSTITLTDAANGALAKQSGVQITKTANGQLIYEVSSSNHPASLAPSGRGGEAGEGALNTISTPRGGQYQVRLPDGSKVWLNAASKLTYPVSFNGREDRRVELSGEAYFEIAKDKDHPFKVKTNTQEVEVLGTHFNINCYADEVSTKTTLLEGSVKVTGSINGRHPGLDPGPPPLKILKPNQQSTLQSGALKIANVNAEEAASWKDGEFNFSSEDIYTIMRKVERWYDVEAIYKDNVGSIKLTGSISRFENISKLLEMLQHTKEVQFKLEGRKITVSKFGG